ncbi:MAG TPA: S26 family signal peptidase [Candidatus Saccharimonadales bacterium]
MFVRRVQGKSMSPFLRDGDIVLARQKNYQVGEVIIFKTPAGEAIKRIEKLTEKGVYVRGDNTYDSFDSLAYGIVKKSAILGAVMARIHFAKATAPPQLAEPRLYWVPIVTGGLLVILVLAQLGTFEEFAIAVGSYGLFTGRGAAIFAIIIAALEILALPALFRLTLSSAIRYISTGAILAAPILWFLLLAFVFVTGLPVENAGLFGGLIVLPVALYTVLLSSSILFMAIASLIVLGPHLSKKATQKHHT